MYPLVPSRSCSRQRSRYSAISLVIESERERTGADAHVDTLLYSTGTILAPFHLSVIHAYPWPSLCCDCIIVHAVNLSLSNLVIKDELM